MVPRLVARLSLLVLLTVLCAVGLYETDVGANHGNGYGVPPDALLWPEQGPDPSGLRCDPVAVREASPRVVSVDGMVDVRVEFNYQCTEEKRRIFFFLAVENSDKTQPSGRTGRRLIANIREGLANFVGKIDYENGSQGGLILYNTNDIVRMDLQGGGGGQQALINAVNNFPTGSSRSARAAGDAVAKATELLAAAEAPPGTMKLILVFDAGAPMTNPQVEIADACQAAKDAGIHMAAFALESAGDRFKECADEISFRGSGREGGQDIPEKLEAFGDGFARADQVGQLLLSDRISQQFDYVPGSGRPTEPYNFMNEIGWDILPPPPPEGHVYEYQLSIDEGAENEVVSLSDEALLTLFYLDDSFGELSLDNPEICIHTPGRRTVCDNFVATLTPPAPTDTPSPTATATSTRPPQTPTPTPTDTPEPPTGIYLPVTVRAAGFEGR